MTVESPEVDPKWMGKRPPRARTRVGNGAALLVGVDLRGTWPKRFREICAGHVADLGGIENLSQAEIALIKRASTLEVELEALEARLARGEGKVDLVEFTQVSNGLRRLFEAIGLKRVQRDVTPTLQEILRGDDTRGAR